MNEKINRKKRMSHTYKGWVFSPLGIRVLGEQDFSRKIDFFLLLNNL